ncbi:hypothetical protein KIN20_024402 [Parelaphostrongylus tenuis]|uniref:Uncharacterized protein n=1 Tax=Parelaphostrongylus tenuis TaxID=148309 RepID=A0AAD5N852_PARTN|nr:hypothetical protein KIN20_024402 [Parelaphostrongylus tenuis]
MRGQEHAYSACTSSDADRSEQPALTPVSKVGLAQSTDIRNRMQPSVVYTSTSHIIDLGM